MGANDCPLCGAALPPGDVPPGDQLAKSDAQLHLADCIRQNVRGSLKRALDLLVDGDDGLEGLFGKAGFEPAPRGLYAVADHFRDVVDEFLATGRRREQFPAPNQHVWVAHHDSHESLIVECPATGEGASQYTLATRFRGPDGEWVGYRASYLGLAGDGFDH